MPPPPSPNFAFLAAHDPRLTALGTLAERYYADDPATCLMKLRQLGELLAQRAAARLGLYSGPDESQLDLLRRLRDQGALDATARQLFHGLRVSGNQATHALRGDHAEALHQLRMARELAVWFHRAFGDDRAFNPGDFVPPPDRAPPDPALLAQIDALEREKAQLAAELAALQAQAAAAPPAAAQAVVARAAQAAQAIELDEAATRRIIDAQLRDAGWEADSARLRHDRGARPQKGRNLAIAEWPTANGPADYVLFAGTTPLAVVEAKRQRKDVAGALQQAARYSRGLAAADGAVPAAGAPWGKQRYAVPFLFATNGRPYLRQIAEKSGIWFRDARRDQNHGRALDAWYTPSGLAALLGQDQAAAEEKLRAEPTDYLGLRDYQIKAIQAVEEALEKGRRACLVAMATGTGKTRTAIGLVYRLVKAGRFRRILFLVDRTALGQQAGDAFNDTRLENLQTFPEIYDLKEIDEIQPDPDTRLHIATIQGLVKRILYAQTPAEIPPVDQYDCLVVDECHRGYGLDREMSEVELGFRDLADYISRYRRVLDHFDAVKIGLTATPALHTTEIFGEPTFRYSYREAVLDGVLIDHELPVRIVTRLSEDGIRWLKGEVVRAYREKPMQLDLVHLDDELHIDIDGFNRQVHTESWNEVVCGELAQHLDPGGDAKTLIFAATDGHADQVVRLLKAALVERWGEVDDDAVLKITGNADKPLQLIRRFKNERLPSIAVTVDLLTTGIDVPRISNLVFLRRVRSRILYEQMLGRATRLCPEIGKTVFRIFDAVDLYAALEAYTDMRPVVPAASLSFQKLVQEIQTLTDEEARQLALDQLVAKLQRRRVTLKGEDLGRFEAIAGMSPRELARQLHAWTPAQAAAWFQQHQYLIPVLDGGLSEGGRLLYISEHTDQLLRTETGYGAARRPDDYLDGFAAFLRENLNKIPALVVVTQRPRELTRAHLRELSLLLDAKGFTERGLRAAWRDTTNADIAASILGHIRRAALGDPLLPYEERVERALQKLLASRAWTAPQRDWLRRIATQIKKETVVDREAMDSGAFKSNGGFKHLDKVFEGKLEAVLGDLCEGIWKDAG